MASSFRAARPPPTCYANRNAGHAAGQRRGSGRASRGGRAAAGRPVAPRDTAPAYGARATGGVQKHQGRVVDASRAARPGMHACARICNMHIHTHMHTQASHLQESHARASHAPALFARAAPSLACSAAGTRFRRARTRMRAGMATASRRIASVLVCSCVLCCVLCVCAQNGAESIVRSMLQLLVRCVCVRWAVCSDALSEPLTEVDISHDSDTRVDGHSRLSFQTVYKRRCITDF